MAQRMIEEPVPAAVDQPKGPLGRLAKKLGHPFREGLAGDWLGELADVGLMALGFGMKEPRDVVKPRAGSGDRGDLGEDGEPLLRNEAWVGWIEAARAILEGEQPVPRKGFSLAKLGKLDLFRREPLDRMSEKGGDSGGHGAPLPGRTAKLKRWRGASVGMSDPTADGGRERGKGSPYHLAPR